MGQPLAPAPLPPLPYRARPPQVLLGVGAVLLVSAGAAVASAYGGTPARLLLLALAAVAAGFAVRAARARLRSSEEVLAASATGLAVSAAGAAARLGGGAATALLAACFLVLHRVAPSTATWPLASWGPRSSPSSGPGRGAGRAAHRAYLGVALVGLGIALFGRPVVARLALLTTAPWWVAGVVSGSVDRLDRRRRRAGCPRRSCRRRRPRPGADPAARGARAADRSAAGRTGAGRASVGGRRHRGAAPRWAPRR